MRRGSREVTNNRRAFRSDCHSFIGLKRCAFHCIIQGCRTAGHYPRVAYCRLLIADDTGRYLIDARRDTDNKISTISRGRGSECRTFQDDVYPWKRFAGL